MISAILREDSSICAIDLMVLPTTSLPRLATSRVSAVIVLACCAFSAFCRTVEDISSIDDEVFSSTADCDSVRCDRSVVPLEISLDAPATWRAASTMASMVSCSRSAARLKSSLICS